MERKVRLPTSVHVPGKYISFVSFLSFFPQQIVVFRYFPQFKRNCFQRQKNALSELESVPGRDDLGWLKLSLQWSSSASRDPAFLAQYHKITGNICFNNKILFKSLGLCMFSSYLAIFDNSVKMSW